MKKMTQKLATCIVMLFGFMIPTQAQCPTPNQWGEIYLTTQAEVNAFAVNYPNCTEIEGHLYIGDEEWENLTDITDLTPLSNLTSVEVISIHFTQVTSLSGLENITNANSIDILENPQLTSITALSNLTSLEEALTIEKNTQLTSLTGLDNLTTIGGLYINNNAVTSLSPLENLTSIDWSGLGINEDALTSLSGLENLTSVVAVFLTGNAQLTDISALQNIDPTTLGVLRIINNPLLSVCHLSNFCTYLQQGLGWLTDIANNAGDCINEQAVLNACATSLPQCPTGDVELTLQAEVNQFIIDYPNCTEIEGDLLIGDYSNPTNITDLTSLSNLTSVGGIFSIYNTQLTSLSGLDNLISLGELNIVGNNALISLSGLNNLTTMTNPTGNLFIYENNTLNSLTALDNLTSVGGLSINSNPQLTSLSGLNNLNYVGWILDIYGNSQLTDISALQNVNLANVNEEWWAGLFIWDNPLLEVCNLSNFCTYLANPANTHPRDISGNAGDCISEQAVLNACSLSIDDMAFENVKFYPNPATSIVYIETTQESPLQIADITGKIVHTQNLVAGTNQIDVSGLSAGVYFLKTKGETLKLVNQ